MLARSTLIAVGFHGCIRVHGLLARPEWRNAMRDARPLAAIAVPAVVANIATPFGNAIVQQVTTTILRPTAFSPMK